MFNKRNSRHLEESYGGVGLTIFQKRLLFCQIVHFKRLIMVYSTRKADFRNQSQRLNKIKILSSVL